MSVPPELMAALQGGNADAGFLAGPPEAAPPPEQAPTMPTPEELLNEMIDAAKTYLHAETDPGQLAKMTKVLDSLMQNLAQEQKEMHDALGGKVSPRLMARNLSG